MVSAQWTLRSTSAPCLQSQFQHQQPAASTRSRAFKTSLNIDILYLNEIFRKIFEICFIQDYVYYTSVQYINCLDRVYSQQNIIIFSLTPILPTHWVISYKQKKRVFNISPQLRGWVSLSLRCHSRTSCTIPMNRQNMILLFSALHSNTFDGPFTLLGSIHKSFLFTRDP